jgi:hypothetical protein
MSETSKQEYLAGARKRYTRRNRAGKTRLLDEVCEALGWGRKHAIKALNGRRSKVGRRGRSGRKKDYGEDVAEVVASIWKWSEQPCSLRLKAALPGWLPSYERRHGELGEELRQKVLGASPRTLERLLEGRKCRASGRLRKRGRTSHALKKSIEIRCGRWEVDGPGWLEADTVSHGGGACEGNYLWSLTMVDILSGWTELRASWNCGAHNICTQIADAEDALPFEIKGFDCDNGPEFLNHHLAGYLRGKEGIRRRGWAVRWTRSRPYRKNDQAHVEQKNFTHVRQLLGYERLDDERLVAAVNALYKEAWVPLQNHFCPVMKLVEKTREGSRWVKRYDTPATPCQRLLDCPGLPAEAKDRLRRERDGLDPIGLSEGVERHLRKIARLLAKIAKEREEDGDASGGGGAATPGGDSAPAVSADAETASAPSPPGVKRKPTTKKKALPKGKKTKRRTAPKVSSNPTTKTAA